MLTLRRGITVMFCYQNVGPYNRVGLKEGGLKTVFCGTILCGRKELATTHHTSSMQIPRDHTIIQHKSITRTTRNQTGKYC